MKKVLCVKSKAELDTIPLEEITICPFNYEEGLGCQVCGKTLGLLIRTTKFGDYGLGDTLKKTGFGSYHVLGSSTTTFNLTVCGCSRHFKITREVMQEIVNYRGCGMELVNWENLGLPD